MEASSSKVAVIYRIDCAETGRFYIGSSPSFLGRKHAHLSDLHYQRHTCKALQADFNRLGEQAFEFSVLRFVPYDGRLTIEMHEIKCARQMGYNLYNGVTSGKRKKSTEAKSDQRLYGQKPAPAVAPLVPLMTLEEVAHYLSLPLGEVKRLMCRKTDALRAIWLDSNKFRFSKDEVDRWREYVINRHCSIAVLLQ